MRSRRIKRWLKCLTVAGLALTAAAAVAFLIAWWAFPFPIEQLDNWPVSPMVTDVRGQPMLGLVGRDEQWRRPVGLDRISRWLIEATIAVEDRRFYDHPGVDCLAVLRAAAQNITHGRIVSGASTLDMQLCRMMGNRPRTLQAKAIEAFRALQLNRLKSKDEILSVYLNVAPYGRNIRGAEAASRAYFGKHAADLSLAEAALLAGLPQSPSRYRPDKHLQAAIERQKWVLHRMVREGMIDRQQYRRAQADPIVIRRLQRPRRAIHAAWWALNRRPTGGRTTIDLDIQVDVQRLADLHRRTLPRGTELAVAVIDIPESAIVAMIGSGDPGDPIDGQVNGALARRSPGSALKPFIYATAFEAERLNGHSLVYDVPIRRGGWSPSNFNRTFSGQVMAADALRRSLNIPAILVAEGVGLARCCGVMETAGLRLPPNARAHAGLAIAVGGVDVTLLDLTNAYATLGRGGLYRPLRLFVDETGKPRRALTPNVCAGISDILSSRRRRPRGMEDLLDRDVPWFMWKTGTSTARRDAWAVGHNGRYAVGVWVGRFRGTGRVPFVGAEAAEPLLAELFDSRALRTDDDPPAPAPILVRRPLPRATELDDTLHITAPGNGETFIAVRGNSIVHPRSNQDGRHMWFLNDGLLDNDQWGRLVLPPGRYELRCVNSTGQSSSVWFIVRGPGSWKPSSRPPLLGSPGIRVSPLKNRGHSGMPLG